MTERKCSPRTGAPCPPPVLGTPLEQEMARKAGKTSFRQRLKDDEYLMIFVAGLDPWLTSRAIWEGLNLQGRLTHDKIRRIRRLTYSSRLDDFIRDTLGEIAQPQNWYRQSHPDGGTDDYTMDGSHFRSKQRQCPSMDELADRLDSLRIDGRKTMRWWND